jgi:uncharacterized membrane protein
MQHDERGQIGIVIVLCIIAVGIAAAYSLWNSRSQDKIAIVGDPSYGNKELSPGGVTTVTVKIKNLSHESVAHNVSVEIAPFKTSVVQVSENRIAYGDLGPGEERSPSFSISIAQGSNLSGTYNITISASVDSPFQGDSVLTTITVT